MKKYFKASDDRLYLNVTEKAHKLFDSNLFELYVLWEKTGTTFRLPVTSEAELNFAMSQKEKFICIEIGSVEELSSYLNVKPIRLDKAETISHDGYLYVKCNDILY